MEENSANFILPPAPGGLCFDRNYFVKTHFSVDDFIQDHQNSASLETIRDDLGVYLKVLRLAMIDLINKDYANFVKLSATLIGFENTIAKIQAPLTQTNNELQNVKHCLEETMAELSMWLSEKHNLQKNKQLLYYYSQTTNNLKILNHILYDIKQKNKNKTMSLINRVSTQYNQLKFSISKCESILKAEHKTQFNIISNMMIEYLNELVFQSWTERNDNNLLRVLIILASLDKVKETEMAIRHKAVAPLLQDIINESSLQKHINGLQGIYESILSLLENELKLFRIVMEHRKLSIFFEKYRFIVNCFWCEIANRLEVNLTSIFAPGNPQNFFVRYNESMKFLRKLEQYCVDKETKDILYNTREYKSFLRRWNLPVYFQIRFQEIAGSCEMALQTFPTIQNNEDFLLIETYKCWQAMSQCWSDSIFIEALTYKFWKLTLQIIARYVTCIQAYCSQKDEVTADGEIDHKSIDMNIKIHLDTQTLIKKLPDISTTIENKVSKQHLPHMRTSLNTSEERLRDSKKFIKDRIISIVFRYYDGLLKQVSDIPRLYRKTNRNAPTKSCAYIESLSRSILVLRKNLSKDVDKQFVGNIFEDLFNELTVSYCKYVTDVLTSVQKTEDSLRRLKQIHEKPSQQSDTTGVSDGDKIRMQLKIDVFSYGKIMESIFINIHNILNYKDISDMVIDAVKNI